MTMPTSKEQIKRLGIIDSCIGSPFYFGKKDLIDAIAAATGEEVSISTIEKDMHKLKNKYDAPIVCVKAGTTTPYYKYKEKYDFWKVFLQYWSMFIDFPKHIINEIKTEES